MVGSCWHTTLKQCSLIFQAVQTASGLSALALPRLPSACWASHFVDCSTYLCDYFAANIQKHFDIEEEILQNLLFFISYPLFFLLFQCRATIFFLLRGYKLALCSAYPTPTLLPSLSLATKEPKGVLKAHLRRTKREFVFIALIFIGFTFCFQMFDFMLKLNSRPLVMLKNLEFLNTFLALCYKFGVSLTWTDSMLPD